MRNRVLTSVLLILLLSADPLHAAEPDEKQITPSIAESYPAKDTLQTQTLAASDDQQNCLAGLCWTPAAFTVSLEETENSQADFLVRFPSPQVSQWPENNRVAMEWYAAKNEAGEFITRPAIVVVHESGRGMTVGRLFARSFQKQGYHAFLLHLPGYGARSWGKRPEATELMVLLRQAIADVRRARDAVASLPQIQTESISLQGTSLGGIVSATVAGLDHGYSAVFLLLAGGDLNSLIAEGEKDAAKLRQQLEQAGATQEDIREYSRQIEPLRLASRMPADRVWLYSGKYDTVVPMKNAYLLAEAGGLAKSHHVIMPADHYSGILYIPLILKHIDDSIQSLTPTP